MKEEIYNKKQKKPTFWEDYKMSSIIYGLIPLGLCAGFVSIYIFNFFLNISLWFLIPIILYILLIFTIIKRGLDL